MTVVLSEFALRLEPHHQPGGSTGGFRTSARRNSSEVSGLDALIDRTTNAGYRFLSVGAKPIQRAFGRFVFAIDPDGVT